MLHSSCVACSCITAHKATGKRKQYKPKNTSRDKEQEVFLVKDTAHNKK